MQVQLKRIIQRKLVASDINLGVEWDVGAHSFSRYVVVTYSNVLRHSSEMMTESDLNYACVCRQP